MYLKRELSSEYPLHKPVLGAQIYKTGCTTMRLWIFHFLIARNEIWMPLETPCEHPDFCIYKMLEISIARFRQPGDHGCAYTALDPWLCVAAFRQVCGLSIRFFL
jgi:hypothetical protein